MYERRGKTTITERDEEDCAAHGSGTPPPRQRQSEPAFKIIDRCRQHKEAPAILYRTACSAPTRAPSRDAEAAGGGRGLLVVDKS
jgi:hypothetical protein